MLDKILLAIDGSEGSSKATRLAAELAHAMASEVLVFHVREVEVAKFSGTLETPPEAAELVNQVVRDLAAEGIVAKGDARSTSFGRAAREIVEEAEASHADAIVMGSRGLSDWAAALVGSVAHKVVNLAHCPVVIAR